MTVHLALRPVASRIDRLPAADEVETIYRFRAVCHTAEEAHIRALVVQALTGGQVGYPACPPPTAATSTSAATW